MEASSPSCFKTGRVSGLSVEIKLQSSYADIRKNLLILGVGRQLGGKTLNRSWYSS